MTVEKSIIKLKLMITNVLSLIIKKYIYILYEFKKQNENCQFCIKIIKLFNLSLNKHFFNNKKI